MLEILIVGLIVGGSAWYAGSKYLPASWLRKLGKKTPSSGCGSGCDSCGSCDTPTAPTAPTAPPESKHRVITLHKA